MSTIATPQTQFPALLSPIKIGPLQLKNRIAMAPMNETLSDGDGRVSEQLVSYFAARAKGGTSLLITGAIMATRLASEFVWGVGGSVPRSRRRRRG